MERVDFHIHYDPLNEDTVYSAIESAKKSNVTAISILARGEISDNLKRYIEYAEKLKIHMIPGVESLVSVGGRMVEIVSLGFDYNNKEILDIFGQSANKKRNIEIAMRQKNFLTEKGFYFDDLIDQDQAVLDKVMSGLIVAKAINLCEVASRSPYNSEIVQRLKDDFPKVWCLTISKYSEMLEKANLAAVDAKFLWLLFFAPGRGGFLSVQRPLEEVISAVHVGGGLVLYSPEGNFSRELWSELLDIKIDGIMGWHGGNLELDRDTIADLISNGLLILGGSDFDPCKNHWQIGVGGGEMYISRRRYNDLINTLNRKR